MTEIFPFEDPSKTKRIVMAVEYKGRNYRGWQIQRTGVSTIQATLEKALSKIANQEISTIVAGRTDAGVHATNQIIHFDTSAQRSMYGWSMGVNGALPNDISIKWAHEVDETFHARFTAKERAYRFVIHNNWIRSAALEGLVTWEQYELDVDLMQEAANLLLGTHDFSSFRASECQAHSPVKTLRELTLKRYGEFIVIQTRADGYLHHMVRNLVGVLLPIGRGRKPISYATQVLEAKNRNKGGVTAKGDGLYFVRAQYERDDLPCEKAGPVFIQPLIDSDGAVFSPI